MRRVVVGGSTGSGKSTFARALAERMGVPLIECDALMWGPNWTAADPDVFRDRVAAAIAADAWVLDGNYSRTRDLTWARADTFVWLDFPFFTILWRLFKRTNRRIFRREELWAGNRERFANAYLSRESLYLWLIRKYWERRRTWPLLFAQPQYAHLTVHRLRSPREATAWLDRAGAEYAATEGRCGTA